MNFLYRNKFTSPGLTILIVGAVYLFFNFTFVRDAIKTEGIYIDIKDLKAETSKKMYKEGDVVVQFKDEKGNLWDTSPGFNSAELWLDWFKGSCWIYYNPQNPSDNRISKIYSIWLDPLIVILVGLGIFWIERRW
jgi:hypothetical protein